MAPEVDLVYGVGGSRRIAFAPLTGWDERAAAGADELLARLAREGPGLVHGAALAELTIGDRDRALAGLYDTLYGSEIVADAVCKACSARYEMRFDLGALVASRRPERPAEGEPPAIAVDGSLVRLPRRSDISGSPENFLARLTRSGPVPQVETVAPMLEAADPALELDLAGTCPECEVRQTVPFAIAAFLEGALRRDLAFLAREIHLIASAYQWSLDEILSLTRAERHAFARLLIAEREAASLPKRRAS
jgi:hypothetical protein